MGTEKISRVLLFVFLMACIVLPFAVTLSAPSTFPQGQMITIQKGSGLSGVSDFLASRGAARYSLPLKVTLYLFGGGKNIKAGDYIFEKPLSTLQVAWRVVQGQHNIPLIKITIPEGTSLAQIPAIVDSKLAFFDTKDFLRLTKGKEGYLFPDTYLFPKDESTGNFIRVMEDDFNKRLEGVQDKISAFGKPLSQVVIMASILEKEARTSETRRTIAGILWKRLQIGMPLQVDSSLTYVSGKNTFQLTSDDLNNSSPYNTYKYKGLPPGPITNPGLDALLDAVTPISSQYFYFLSDKNGVMHYAVTLDEHNKNKSLYLK